MFHYMFSYPDVKVVLDGVGVEKREEVWKYMVYDPFDNTYAIIDGVLLSTLSSLKILKCTEYMLKTLPYEFVDIIAKLKTISYTKIISKSKILGIEPMKMYKDELIKIGITDMEVDEKRSSLFGSMIAHVHIGVCGYVLLYNIILRDTGFFAIEYVTIISEPENKVVEDFTRTKKDKRDDNPNMKLNLFGSSLMRL